MPENRGVVEIQERLKEAMQSGAFVAINVQYKNIQGYHVSTSDDVDGLYIASKDPRKAFKAAAARWG